LALPRIGGFPRRATSARTLQPGPAATPPPAANSAFSGLRSKAAAAPDWESFDDSPPPPDVAPAPAVEPQDAGLEKLECTFIRKLFGSVEKGFMVLLIRHAGGEGRASVRNAAFEFSPRDKIVLNGKWGTYKGQPDFAATSAFPAIPKGAKGVVAWLKSGKVKGVSAGTANKLADVFGDDLENKIGDVDALVASGVSEKRAAAIVEAWLSSSGQAELFSLLARHGLGDALISKVVRRYGAASVRIIEENPWVLSETIDGIGFDTADKVAMNAGRLRNDPMRYRAALRAAIDQATTMEGHCGLPKLVALDYASKLLGRGVPQADLAIELEAICDGRLHLFDEETALVYPVGLHAAERLLAARIIKMAADSSAAVPRDQAIAAVQAACVEMGVQLDPGQSEAAVTALSKPFSIITGGPGTGKTTTQRVIVKALKNLGKQVALAAPTGRAAKKLSDVSGENASTLHRLLQFSTEAGGFTYNSQNPLPEDWPIIDECSMVGVKLAHAFISAVGEGAGLTLVGDVDQLPSVDSGQVLRDLIASSVVPVTRLSTIHRQGNDSGIVVAAHRINHGKYPLVEGEDLDGFSVDPQSSPASIISRVIELVSRDMPARGYDPLKDVQVLAGMRKGDVGVGALNLAIKAVLNPATDDDEHTVRFGQKIYSVGDRVMQMRNDYLKGVYNGEVGMVKAVGRGRDDDGDMAMTMTVDYSGYEVKYLSRDTNDLEQAWACTVHKSQGCEFPVVVFVCPFSHRIMLTRNLVYTAVTRAKTECIVVGEERTLHDAIDTMDKSRRYTGLKERLRGADAPEPTSLPHPR
jgi:exodeoxyribonuclease V alpha subunit